MREVYETAVILGEDAGLTLVAAALEDGVVMGDRTRLRQLFLNLVTNAIKYTPRGGHVELVGDASTATTRSRSPCATRGSESRRTICRTCSIDSGAPIARARAQSERGGFGLGLAISQWIVQAHGGYDHGAVAPRPRQRVHGRAADRRAEPRRAHRAGAEEPESATEPAEG